MSQLAAVPGDERPRKLSLRQPDERLQRRHRVGDSVVHQVNRGNSLAQALAGVALLGRRDQVRHGALQRGDQVAGELGLAGVDVHGSELRLHAGGHEPRRRDSGVPASREVDRRHDRPCRADRPGEARSLLGRRRSRPPNRDPSGLDQPADRVGLPHRDPRRPGCRPRHDCGSGCHLPRPANRRRLAQEPACRRMDRPSLPVRLRRHPGKQGKRSKPIRPHEAGIGAKLIEAGGGDRVVHDRQRSCRRVVHGDDERRVQQRQAFGVGCHGFPDLHRGAGQAGARDQALPAGDRVGRRHGQPPALCPQRPPQAIVGGMPERHAERPVDSSVGHQGLVVELPVVTGDAAQPGAHELVAELAVERIGHPGVLDVAHRPAVRPAPAAC